MSNDEFNGNLEAISWVLAYLLRWGLLIKYNANVPHKMSHELGQCSFDADVR